MYCTVLGPFISVMALLVPRMRYMIQVQSEINKSTNSSGVSRSLTTIKPSGTVHSDVDLKKNMARMKRRIRKLETALAKATGGTLETIREEISDSEDEAPIDEVTEAKA
eukprot:CAMPEP_0168526310 /NCGR_PEP_ID=MMETSP0405-20121227/11885_1 /TAXON_ID=498012 /ORGANISM="Trichosphaerium sp, Strain Am-I-7 wt" /LENGTH=108 /DNA_ID=CAMNT_0008549115 /DNA_START=112 /DNA_END=435 /DNA_ORIENTATION=+